MLEYWTSKGYSDTMNAIGGRDMMLEKRAAGLPKVKWKHVREAIQLASVPVSAWGAAEMLKQRKLQQQEAVALTSLGKRIGYNRSAHLRKKRV
jgi:hypothetical protein